MTLIDTLRAAESQLAKTGGILHLPDAIERYPDAGVLVYNRVSAHAGAGKGKARLEEKTAAVVYDVCELVGSDKLLDYVNGVEQGKLSANRRKFSEASTRADIVDPENWTTR